MTKRRFLSTKFVNTGACPAASIINGNKRANLKNVNSVLELNEMECREPEKYVAIEGSPSTNISVIVRENYADNILVAGPRYQVEDLRCGYSNHLGDDTSGVLCKSLII